MVTPVKAVDLGKLMRKDYMGRYYQVPNQQHGKRLPTNDHWDGISPMSAHPTEGEKINKGFCSIGRPKAPKYSSDRKTARGRYTSKADHWSPMKHNAPAQDYLQDSIRPIKRGR